MLPYFAIFGSSFQASDEEINQSAKDYIRLYLRPNKLKACFNSNQHRYLMLVSFLKKLTNISYLIMRAIAAISSEAIANFDFSMRIFLPVII